jgi:hypothetical protein
VQTGGLFNNIGNYAINGQPFGIIKGSYWTRDQKSGQLIVGQMDIISLQQIQG